MKHVILTIVLLLASGLVIAQTKMSDQLSKTTKMNAQSKILFLPEDVSGEQNIS